MKRRALVTAAGAALTLSSLPALAVGRPMRTIIVVSGGYFRYQKIFAATIQGLAKLGIIQYGGVVVPEDTRSLLPMWRWLIKNAGGNQLQFLIDGYYSYEWKEIVREEVRAEVLERLRTRQDVDLILTFGTNAGLDMVRNVTTVPVLHLASSDPVASGIVASAEDSGRDNVHAVVTGDFWRWQVLRFHYIFHFERLATIAPDTNIALIGASDIQQVAASLGIQYFIATYHVDNNNQDAAYGAFRDALLEALDKQRADAVMLPWFPANDEQMQEILHILTKRGIPAFSQMGSEPVKRGILIGVGDDNLSGLGYFEARVIQKVLAGVKPRAISQRYEQSQGLVLNLRTAMEMGWNPPLGLLVTVEKTYNTQNIVGEGRR